MTGTKALTLTERVISHMLKENTGRHMLDSGGAYGRNWERNQDRDFKSEPASKGRFVYRQYGDKPAYWEIEYEINVFHYLSEYLAYDRGMTRRFKRATQAFTDQPWLELMCEWAEEMHQGRRKPETFNSYNGPSHLSQVIQAVSFTVNDIGYVLLQIHGGCDVLGGYTEPRVFRILGGDGDSSPWYWRHADDPRLWCVDAGAEDSASWDMNGYPEDFKGEDLSEILVTNDESLRGQGYLYVSPDGKMYHHIAGAEIDIDGWERGMD